MRTTHLIWPIVCLALPSSFACGGDGGSDRGGDGMGSADGGEGGHGGSGGGDDGAGSDGGTEGDDGGGDGDDGGGGQPDEGTPAGGITIDALHINQGVEIQVAEAGAFVPEPDRNAPLIGGRPALIRAFWTLDSGFEPRELEGRLVVTYPDGSVKTFRDTTMVDGPSNPNNYPGGFAWGIVAEDFVGDASIHVGVYEVDDIERGEPRGHRLPAEGEQPLEGVVKRMLLDVVVVPTCNRAPLADWEQEIFTAYLYNTYPINEIAITFHDPVSSGCDEYEAAYTTMPDLRYAESSPPWRYYGGLVNASCGGVAQYGDSDWAWQMDAPRAFGSCDWRGTFPTVDLFAHELGHVHSRDHTFEDYEYPYEDCGARENVGFGLLPAQMPSSSWGAESVEMQQLIPVSRAGCTQASWNDFMSYAYPYWVSDYTYRGVAELIWVTSDWADQGIQPGPGTTVRGVVMGDGKVHWGRTRGTSTELEPSGMTARFFAGDTVVGELDVEISTGHRDPGPGEPGQPTPLRQLTIQIPDELAADRFEIELDGERRSFSTAQWR